ncbi:MAG: hypothetical protein HY718_05140, partial [Planctomycetes bacterium]|nr:hypothetical protein [Planctomycetota bacterium]
MPPAPPSAAQPLTWRRLAAGILLLTLLTAVLYGRSISGGLVLDDHNHRAELRDGNWSFRSLVEASHLGGTHRRVQMWWQHDADLYFFRPLAFLIIRATYVAGGWRPEVMHVASLAWGVICATLVFALAWRATGRFGWALFAAVVFVMHPNNFLAPRWVACQNEQMAAAFTLAALLTYGYYSGWWPSASTASPTGRLVALLAALACYVAALGCRESAIILPAILLAGDLATRGRTAGTTPAGEIPRRSPRVAAYLCFAAIAVAYLLVRRHMLGPVTIPDRPYAWPPGEPGFLGFILDKFVYYVIGLWAYIPIVGFAGQQQMHAHPAVFYGLFALIVIVWTTILIASRPPKPAMRSSMLDLRSWIWPRLSDPR